ncbi:hypothetical protein V6N11_045534 [Hibiscus sabdariffa]|uniref:Sugar phosphate transporter domain-containing protein n=1 Tax=Hibiscus sabdariffa TaxID=183260 RepID=A0ABR2Q194_9ROSI
MCHMTACSLLSYIAIAWMKMVPMQTIRSRVQFLKISALSLVFCVSVVLGNISLRFLAVSFNQAVGATTQFSGCWGYDIEEGGLAYVYYPYSRCYWGYHCQWDTSSSLLFLANFILVNRVFIYSVLSCAFQLQLQELSSRFYKEFCFLLKAVVFLLPAALIMEENVVGIALALARDDAKIIWYLLFNSALAYFVNLTNFLVTKHTSALTLQVLGNTKGAVAVVVSILIFQNPVSVTGMLAIGLFTCHFAATILFLLSRNLSSLATFVASIKRRRSSGDHCPAACGVHRLHPYLPYHLPSSPTLSWAPAKVARLAVPIIPCCVVPRHLGTSPKRKMQVSGATELASKGEGASDGSNVKVKGEIDDPLKSDMKDSCPCGSSLETKNIIKRSGSENREQQLKPKSKPKAITSASASVDEAFTTKLGGLSVSEGQIWKPKSYGTVTGSNTTAATATGSATTVDLQTEERSVELSKIFLESNLIENFKVDNSTYSLAQIRATFYPKFENEKSDQEIMIRMIEMVSKGLACLEVSLKHSGSLFMYAGNEGGAYAKNSFGNIYTAVGVFVLGRMFHEAWGSKAGEMQAQFNDFIERNRISISMELVTAVLGDHGQRPREDYAVVTAVTELGNGKPKFYSTPEVIAFCRNWRLPTNHVWLFSTRKSVTSFFAAYDLLYEEGTATSVCRALDEVADISVPGSKDHVKVLGEILEGLVARIVSHESSKHMEEALKDHPPPPGDGAGIDLGSSLREICAANRSEEKQCSK